MSSLPSTASTEPISKDDLLQTADAIGYSIPEASFDDFLKLLERGRQALKAVSEMEDYQPIPDFDLTPRNEIHFPSKKENPLNGWAWRCHCAHKSPSSSLLQGKSVCLKDNISMAGVPCLLGTESFTGWVPKTDATIVTRILDSGGIISGKAACENLSRGAVSCTSATGPVHNPYAHGYSVGGSSSGTAALVASGAADMGIGCDQGGSIRIPAALCGLYGLKATTGLVPYTGIASNDASVDYVGPITKTCMDCALLLEAIAGVDGFDDRQIAGTPFRKDVLNYASILESTKGEGVKGMKIGVVKEGFQSVFMVPEIEKKFRAAVAVFEKLGATVEEVSIPIHGQARAIYAVLSKMSNHMGMLGKSTGRRQVMLTDLFEKKSLPYTQDSLEKMSALSIDGLLVGEYAWKHYPQAYAKSINFARKLKDAYDAVLSKYDLILMPTTPTASDPLPSSDATPLQHLDAVRGKTENTSPFNASGHPSLAVPIGFVSAETDVNIKVPASMQITGKYWDEITVLKAAYAWENAEDWKKF